MKHRWPARGGVFALALLAGLGACADSPIEPGAPPAAETAAEAEALETTAAGFGAADAFLTVSAGLAFTCGTTLDGAAYCWGENGSGQLGTGDLANRAAPARVSGVPAAWAASTGAAHSCALARNGGVYCWGDNSVGQLGDGTTSGSAVPVRAQAPAGVFFLSVTTGAVHTCAVAASGDTYCWGDNSLGQLGNGGGAGSGVPVKVRAPAGVRLLSAVSGDGAVHTCGVASDGAAYCWGDNAAGQLGTGTTASSAVPARVASGAVRFLSAAGSGFGHSCAISTSGEGYCWGDNDLGQLGDGTTTDRLVPTPVQSTRRFASLVTGWFHSCGATLLSGAQCWGDANSGKLGNGAAAGFSAVPVTVASSQGFGRMDPGSDHSCSRRRDGEAFCWGQGFSGQLGDDNAATFSAVPVRVSNPSASTAAPAPSFNRTGEGSAPAARGLEAWCAVRADRARIAACS